jgi:hypothetical protein
LAWKQTPTFIETTFCHSYTPSSASGGGWTQTFDFGIANPTLSYCATSGGGEIDTLNKAIFLLNKLIN